MGNNAISMLNSPRHASHIPAQRLVYVRYQDHVLYHRGDPLSLKPQVRECVGWLVRDCADYIVIAWDLDAEPPTLRGGDPKASGLVLIRGDILELKRLALAE